MRVLNILALGAFASTATAIELDTGDRSWFGTFREANKKLQETIYRVEKNVKFTTGGDGVEVAHGLSRD